MNYRFKYRRRLFFRSFVVEGHKYDEPQDKMILYMPSGGLREIPHWRDCSARLGSDWVFAVKKSMEQKAGQAITLAGDKC